MTRRSPPFPIDGKASRIRPKYESIRRSVYAPGVTRPPSPPIGEAVVCTCALRPFDPPEMLYCKDGDCLNVASRFLCHPKLCQGGERCTNVPLFKRKSPGLALFHTKDQRGWGLRIEEEVKRGDFIIAYVGEILDRKEFEQRVDEARRQGNRKCYIMHLEKDLFVDSENSGNLSRFINSSCAPNCESQKWTDPSTGQTEVGIFALREINAGTEITINYSFQGFGRSVTETRENSFACLCHACCIIRPAARVWVMKTVGKRVRVQWDDGLYDGKVEHYDSEKKKFKVLYDDGDIEALSLGLPAASDVENDKVPFKFLDATS